MKVFFVVLHLLVNGKSMEYSAFATATLSDCGLMAHSITQAYESKQYDAFRLIRIECKPGVYTRPHR